jgi:hypothetical protein
MYVSGEQPLTVRLLESLLDGVGEGHLFGRLMKVEMEAIVEFEDCSNLNGPTAYLKMS